MYKFVFYYRSFLFYSNSHIILKSELVHVPVNMKTVCFLHVLITLIKVEDALKVTWISHFSNTDVKLPQVSVSWNIYFKFHDSSPYLSIYMYNYSTHIASWPLTPNPTAIFLLHKFLVQSKSLMNLWFRVLQAYICLFVIWYVFISGFKSFYINGIQLCMCCT